MGFCDSEIGRERLQGEAWSGRPSGLGFLIRALGAPPGKEFIL